MTTTDSSIFFMNQNHDCLKFWTHEVKQSEGTRLRHVSSYSMSGPLTKYSSKRQAYRTYNMMLLDNRLMYINDAKDLLYIDLENETLNLKCSKATGTFKYCLSITRGDLTKELYSEDKRAVMQWYYHIKKYCIQTVFSTCYLPMLIIGHGYSSKVYKVSSNMEKKIFAAKIIPKSILKEQEKLMCLREELRINRAMDHPYITKFYEAHEDRDSIYLIFDYEPGGDFADLLMKKHKIAEDTARIIIKKLLEVLVYFQSLDIVHRDIKPDNILLSKKGDETSIKVTDFGLSENLTKLTSFNSFGTPGFAAPEVIRGEKYGHKVDVFSAGIVFYILLCGRKPFRGVTTKDIVVKNEKCHFKFKDKYWHDISETSRNLVKKMTAKSLHERLNAKEALHFLLKSEIKPVNNIIEVSKLSSFEKLSSWITLNTAPIINKVPVLKACCFSMIEFRRKLTCTKEKIIGSNHDTASTPDNKESFKKSIRKGHSCRASQSKLTPILTNRLPSFSRLTTDREERKKTVRFQDIDDNMCNISYDVEMIDSTKNSPVRETCGKLFQRKPNFKIVIV